MNLTVGLNFIAGMSVGLEYVYEEEAECNHIAVDLLIVRILFSWWYEDDQ